MRKPILLLAALSGALTPIPALAARDGTPPELSLEQRMRLRCSAAFALIAQRQARGEAEALRYPPLATRGREFFVRSAAAVMEAGSLDRGAIEGALTREAQALLEPGTLYAIMPACFQALEDSGL